MTRPITIDDVDDPRLAALRELRGGNLGELIAVESELAVTRLLQSAVPVRFVACIPSRVERLAPLARAPLYVCSQALLDALAGFPLHRGCVALAERPAGSREALTRAWAEARSTVVVAAGIGDPANVGAIVRSARAFGVDAVVCDRRGGDVWSRKAIRAAMGNGFALPVLVDEPLEVLRARPPHVRVVAATLSPRAVSTREYVRPPHVLLMVGNEGEGLRDELRATADTELTIPIEPGADSLNVAAASAVLLYALGR